MKDGMKSIPRNREPFDVLVQRPDTILDTCARDVASEFSIRALRGRSTWRRQLPRGAASFIQPSCGFKEKETRSAAGVEDFLVATQVQGSEDAISQPVSPRQIVAKNRHAPENGDNAENANGDRKGRRNASQMVLQSQPRRNYRKTESKLFDHVPLALSRNSM